MSGDVLATLLTGAGVLVGVWRMLEGMRRDVNGRLDSLAGEVRDVDRRLARLEGWLARDLGGPAPAPETP